MVINLRVFGSYLRRAWVLYTHEDYFTGRPKEDPDEQTAES